MENTIFTVGELSEITGVSRQAIRYYDKIGLLKSERNAGNDYRYYEPIHILYLNTITRLSQLGCSLKEIEKFLAGSGLADVKNMLFLRRQLTYDKISELKTSVKILEQQIEMMETGIEAQEDKGISIKEYPDRYFIYEHSREGISVKQAIMQISKLVKTLNNQGLLFVTNPVFELPEDDTYMKTGFFVTEKSEYAPVKFEILPSGSYASIYHHGVYMNMALTVNKLK